MEVVIFTGIQGSGKSSFFKKRFYDTHVRINLDMLKTRHREWLLVEACLAAGQSFVVDNTNPTAEDRARYIGPAKARGFTVVGYYFQSSIEECDRRNRRRPPSKVIPMGGLLRVRGKLEPPKFKEGFDRLYVVTIGPDDRFIVQKQSPGQR